MPVYNTPEEYLREAIESILTQTFKNFELILVNDGSTNNVEEVILSYADPRIVYVRNSHNLQLVTTLNKGLALCHGEYIARLDADDIALPTRLEKQVLFLDEHADIGLVATAYECIPKRGEWQGPRLHSEIKEALLFEGCALAHSSVMFRRCLGVQYGHEYLHCEDYALWLDLLDKTKMEIIPEVLLTYRWHESNVSIIYADIQKENASRVRCFAQQKYYACDETLLNIFFQEEILLPDLMRAAYFCSYMGQYGRRYHHSYRKALKRIIKNWAFVKFLWLDSVNGVLGVSFKYKLKNTFRALIGR